MALKERPILFNTEMVRAILSGQKTQTRRPIKDPYFMANAVDDAGYWEVMAEDGDFYKVTDYCPFGRVGDRLWVRETWGYAGRSTSSIRFKANPNDVIVAESDPYWKWKPSIHLPKAFARLWLDVIDVRVERLQDISEEDARAEGVRPNYNSVTRYEGEHIDLFHRLWDSVYSNWDDNPWVWVVEFKRFQ